MADPSHGWRSRLPGVTLNPDLRVRGGGHISVVGASPLFNGSAGYEQLCSCGTLGPADTSPQLLIYQCRIAVFSQNLNIETPLDGST